MKNQVGQELEIMDGEIIIFIDSDIIIKPDYLNELDRCFLVNKNIAVIGNRLMLNKPITIDDLTNPNKK